MSDDNRKKSDDNQCCDCVEEMADRLEDFEGFFVHVYEGVNEVFVQGVIDEVIDGKILHLSTVLGLDVSKQTFLPGGGAITIQYQDLFISICEISEFAPLFEVVTATTEQIDAAKRNFLMNNTNTTP
ncbi:hypothetical protein L8956_04110 [Peribacillus frigoritolerans]|uniref:hypothetical protein n=1 Tax=Peribacillus frigoritolerans TaxID=450367 RepID=UPI001EFDA247|nr:hypothetical protein [Peribacillus frigoritolerans]ULM97922.1 hypothetical protein L8956_04110 [Peribacillus frigoritolerans]